MKQNIMRGFIWKKYGQEEMIGFVLILVIVAVIFLVLLGIGLRRPAAEQSVESREVDSFLRAMLGYTTACALGFPENYQEIQDLIVACKEGRQCIDGRMSCEALDEDIKQIMQESWPASEERPVKGYAVEVVFGDEQILSIQNGNITKQYLAPNQALADETGVVVYIYF
jgi:hypothetical protein